MYAHREKKIAYLAHPRTASTSTAAALQTLPGWKLTGSHGHHDGLHGIPGGERPEWLVLTTVRNPFDLVVSDSFSSFKKLAAQGKLEFQVPLFREVVETNSWLRRRFWHVDEADVVMRFETIQNDLEAALAMRGEPMPELPRKAVSASRAGRHYRDFYNDETRAYVEGAFAPELEAHGYRF
jgi:hypothetical protein